jgi:hypothetical protein
MSEVPLHGDPRLPAALRQERVGALASEGIAPPMRVARGTGVPRS